MQVELQRGYKSAPPFTTVSNIRDILCTIDCPVFEVRWFRPYESVYSVRVQTDQCLGNFGTNGKGRSKIYALASAYAEFMERLQNNLLAGRSYSRRMLNELERITNRCYFPDEKSITRSEFEGLPAELLRDICGPMPVRDFSSVLYQRLQSNGREGLKAVPFYELASQTTEYLPLNLLIQLTGSNGMAAGNTLAEAIYQAMCEVVERYTAAEIYYRRLTPPKVPTDFLRSFTREYSIIQEIESTGRFSVEVRDFSLGHRFCSLGVLLVDSEAGRYRLNVGADTSFPVALSRCLTEIHQGYRSANDVASSMLEIPKCELPYFLSDDDEAHSLRRSNFADFTCDGRGAFPRTLFSPNPSYDFDADAFVPLSNYSAECHRLAAQLMRFSRRLFIRDVSFLGFPACFVYAPHLSAIGRKPVDGSEERFNLRRVVKSDRIEDVFFSPFHESTESLQELGDLLEDGPGMLMRDRVKIEVSDDSPWSALPSSYFLTLIRWRLGDSRRAEESLLRFMDSTGLSEKPYYRAIQTLFQHTQIQAGPDVGRKELISGGVEPSVAQKVVDDLFDLPHLFNRVVRPTCPECGKCELKYECYTRGKFELSRRCLQASCQVTPSQSQVGASI